MSGELLVDAKGITKAYRGVRAVDGIAEIRQETSLTVARNLRLGNEESLNRLRGRYISAQQFLQQLNFGVDPAQLVSALGAAQKQMAEIARAIIRKARVIIFDEPTRGADTGAVAGIRTPVNRPADQGIAMVVIASDLPEILALSDRILVCRQGRIVEELPLARATPEAVMFASAH